MMGLLHAKRPPRGSIDAYPSRFQLALRLSAGNEDLPHPLEGAHVLRVLVNCELLFHQVRGEVERLNLHI